MDILTDNWKESLPGVFLPVGTAKAGSPVITA